MNKSSSKSLGIWMLTALVIGNMVGSGAFMLPAALAKIGSIGIIAWALTSVGALCLALMFAHLSGLYPKIGGPYAYCKEGFGRFIGFEIAYLYWIAICIGNAGIVVSMLGYISYFWPTLASDHSLAFLVALAILWGLTAINIFGVKAAGMVQLITVILKIIPLFIIGLVGLTHLHPQYLTSFNISHLSNTKALTDAAALTLWSFIGVEAATVPAGNVINPKRNIPRATIIGALVAAIVYVLATTSVMGIIPMQSLAASHSPFADTATQIFGRWAGFGIAIVAIIATLGTLNGWILVVGQVPYAAASDNLMPNFLKKLSKTGTPAAGLVVSGIFTSILLTLSYQESILQEFTMIITLAVFCNLVPYLMSSLVEIRSYFKERHLVDGHKPSPKILLIGALSLIYTCWAITGVGMEIISLGICLILVGIPLYFIIQWGKRLYGRKSILE